MSDRRIRAGTSDNTLWILLSFGVIVLIGINVITGFIDNNAWVRWIIFFIFSGIFIYCAQYFTGALYRLYINYPVTKTIDMKLPTSLVGSVFFIFFVKTQTDFFREWWTTGSWLVVIFNNLVLLWLAVLIIRLTMKIWRHRQVR